MFFFLWSFLNLLLLLHPCTAGQSCISSCQFDYDLQSAFTLPEQCTTIEQAQCSVRLIFNYITNKVNVQFSSAAIKKAAAEPIYDTETNVRSVINFENDFIQQTVDYSCSTSNKCELDYVQKTAIPRYAGKNCTEFKADLMRQLYSNQTSHRECFLNDTQAYLCDEPCDLLHYGINQTNRACDGRVDLAFETSIGQSTPVNKPEYLYRTYSYACTTEFCNGAVLQKTVEILIHRDEGQCLIVLNDTIDTTTTSTSPINTTAGGLASMVATSSSFLILLSIGHLIYFITTDIFRS